MTVLIGTLAFIVAVGPIRQGHRLHALTTAQTGIAAAVTLATIGGLGGLSGPLFDFGDVSVPTARIAAGIVVVATSLLRLLRPILPGEDRPLLLDPGPATGVAPAAFPVLLQPVVAVVALSAGADRGWLAAVVMASPSLAIFLVAREGHLDNGLATLVRGVAVLGLVIGVVLMVDGVVDV